MARPMGSGNYEVRVPHSLLDALRKEYRFRSDGQLCEFLDVSRSTISKFRHGINEVSADFILRVHKKTGWPVDRIELLLVKTP